MEHGEPKDRTGLDHYFTAAVFLLPALSLNIPSGYSYGAVMLLLGSFYCLPKRGLPILPPLVWWIFGVMVLYSVAWMVDGMIRGEGVSDMDRPSRFLFAAISLLAISQCRIPEKALWAGVAVGCFGAGTITVWQKFFMGAVRPHALATGIIQFGNLAMMLGLLGLCGTLWAVSQRRFRLWSTIMLMSGFSGIYASLLSGSRGAWLALPVALILGFWVVYVKGKRTTVLAFGLIALVALFPLSFSLGKIGATERINQAVSQVEDYLSGQKQTTSVGYRLEMWKGAWQLFKEKPLLGYGEMPYRAAMRDLEHAGDLAPGTSTFAHPHSHWMEALAKTGLLGFLVTFALFLLPFLWFLGEFRRKTLEASGLAVAGIMMPSTLAITGLTHTHFTSMNGVMMYGFMLAILVGVGINKPRNQGETNLAPRQG